VGARAAFGVSDEVSIHYFRVRISISIAAWGAVSLGSPADRGPGEGYVL